MLAGLCFGSSGKMRWGDKVIDDEIDNIKYWIGEIRRDGPGKQDIPHHGSCKWASSRESRQRPMM